MVFYILLFVIANLMVLSEAQKVWQNKHSDVGLNVKQLIKRYGFPFEEHTVLTDDGYYLEIHRIPSVKKSSINLPPILIMPGLFCGSAVWVNMGVNNSLGFILANQGYDVWLINYRGTTWSKNHKHLDWRTDKNEYFNYSFQEIAAYDLPACIDYVLKETKKEKLVYIGHSQGTTTLFALLSDKPNYNEKICLTIALSPVAFTKSSKSMFLKFLIRNRNILQTSFKMLNCYEILPHSEYLTVISQIFCGSHSLFQGICAYLFYIIAGFTSQLNESTIPTIVSTTPAGSSFGQIDHLIQLRNGLFRKYDYGENKNLEKYGQLDPPAYDLYKSKVPIAVFYGSKDGLADPEDVEILVSKLPNVVIKKLLLGFNHIDLMWGVDAEKLVYRDIILLLKSYR